MVGTASRSKIPTSSALRRSIPARRARPGHAQRADRDARLEETRSARHDVPQIFEGVPFGAILTPRSAATACSADPTWKAPPPGSTHEDSRIASGGVGACDLSDSRRRASSPADRGSRLGTARRSQPRAALARAVAGAAREKASSLPDINRFGAALGRGKQTPWPTRRSIEATAATHAQSADLCPLLGRSPRRRERRGTWSSWSPAPPTDSPCRSRWGGARSLKTRACRGCGQGLDQLVRAARPELISETAERLGCQSDRRIDACRRSAPDPSQGWEVFSHGGRCAQPGSDAVE